MSIKKLFDSTDQSRNYLSDATEQEAFEEIESSRNLRQLREKQTTFVPQIDYSDPANFAKFGSAYLYYKSAIERVIDFYPYDGSDAELNEYYNKSLDIEKHIFNNLYPRTNGNIRISSDVWGSLSGSLQSGYGLPSTLEYIDFKGGPHTITTTATAKLFRNPNSSNPESANLYQSDPYVTASLPAGYGSGSRDSNLKADFDKGVTVEFWAKTGSLSTSLTNKQILVDIWNNELSCSAYGGTVKTNANPHYGRITITFNAASAASPFRITAQSGTAGSNGVFEQAIGNDIKVNTFNDWKHYAFVLYNTASNFVTKLYVDGRINDINTVNNITINELNPKNMVGRIGALLTAPSGNAGNAQQVENMVGAGKLSGSIDEFRYWKVARTGKEIGKNWFTQVRGGTNTDIANTTLGVYYKFNEGITGIEATDTTVLDYSGRVSNGSWTTGSWSGNGRLTGSAIVEATASSTEYKDPIIYSTHSDVIALKDQLLKTGSYHDSTNNGSFISLVPSWIVEDDETNETNNLNVVTHIMGAYFDKIHAYISALPSFKNDIYTSASHTPIPFAKHLPQSLGLYTPDIFIDSDILERFMNRNENSLFENDLTETKNLIYLNLYNNLADIYKAKGTEKAIKNILRCFNIDDRLIKLKAYSNNNIYTLSNNLQQTLIRKKSINLNEAKNVDAVVYQAADSSNGDSRGYISGSTSEFKYEDKYGLTLEADVVFPKFTETNRKFDRSFKNVSMFGIYSASVENQSDPTFFASDNVNFQVFAVRDAPGSKNAYFKLTSSLTPFPIPELTSSTFFDVYDNQQWNFSVRIKPSNFPLSDIVTGSGTYTYDIVFNGSNSEIGTIVNSFALTSSITQAKGQNLLRAAKRVFVGAHRTNLTGTMKQKSDVLVSGIRYWGKYLEDSTLEQRVYDINNIGISGSYQNISPLDSNNDGVDILNSNMLVLDWNFDNVTGSDSSGNFTVTDFSSGSATIRDNFGWVGGLVGHQHSGYGYGFMTSSSDVIKKEHVNSYKFVDPEMVVSSDMVQILSDDDLVFGIDEAVPSYVYTLEKSQYAAISEEILQFFAGVADFNNIIGEPVNRYRDRYKSMEKLRGAFFRRVTDIKQVEKFIAYYKWFDDALAQIISQLLPASADFTADTFNTIESHVLERNKYKSQYPTIEFVVPELDAAMEGVEASDYSYDEGSTPMASSARSTKKSRHYWDARAERTASEITSGDKTIDYQRNTIRDVVYNNPHLSSSSGIARSSGSDGYFESRGFSAKRLAKTYKMKVESPFHTGSRTLRGGVNFTNNKNIHFTYNALSPAGRSITDGGIYVPENVLVGFTDDLEAYHETIDIEDQKVKHKRYLKVNHGRDWNDGYGYTTLKSSFVFPFNIISPAVSSGFNKLVVDRITSSLQITNLHHDGYGEKMEIPIQGPFTNYAVGGHQSRHIVLNTGSDDYTNRPEAWKLLLGKISPRGTPPVDFFASSGAIGMVGADYPWPEANALWERPYPMTASHKAVYYRDFIAKRPVNIKNIRMTTGSAFRPSGSTVLGNYSNIYEVVHTVGAFSNPRSFVDNQPTLPTQLTKSTQARSILDIRRNSGSHFEFVDEYSTSYLTGTNNSSIIIGRFSAPGGIEVMSKGYLDFRSSEMSVYNSLLNKNSTVIRSSQTPSGSFSEPIGSGTAGIRVSDIHEKDFGMHSHYARHTARFGRDSLFVTASGDLPGASYTQLPGFHKTHRNRKYVIGVASADPTLGSASFTFETSSQPDNYYVSHGIPRSDRQIAWISSALDDAANVRYFEYAPMLNGIEGYYSGSDGTFTSFFEWVTGSYVTSSGLPGMYQPISRLNILTLDPVSSSTDNIIGYTRGYDASAYFNSTLINNLPALTSSNLTSSAANYLNVLLTRRGDTFGWTWRMCRNSDNPITIAERQSNEITVVKKGDNISRYSLRPVSLRGRPVLMNITAPTSNESQSEIEDNTMTLKITNNNEKIYFSDVDLEDYVFGSDVDLTETPYDQILSIVNSNGGYNINWISYSEALFPSARNEFKSSSMERTNYDNRFWRHLGADRVSLGAEIPNSFNLLDNLSQSSWPLDAQDDFETRTNHVTSTAPALFGFSVAGKAGELQNNYFSFFTGTLAASDTIVYRAPRMLKLGALYNRKQMITTRKSAVSPSGIDPKVTYVIAENDFNQAIGSCAGEAKWEADSLAGIMVKTASIPATKFEAKPSKPWFTDYDDFKEDVKLVAKGYSIVPEFRISEHVEDYVKYGINNEEKLDTFEIPGTSIDSTTGSFYKDYSNTEFFKDFLKVKNDSSLKATQIKLVCSAALRFNPYKGFYPVQRTLDLVSQFSSSYGNCLVGNALSTAGNISATANYAFAKLLTPQSAAGSLRPLIQTLYAPGILYNSIKSGIAVDYPIVTDKSKVARSMHYYGTSSPSTQLNPTTDNWALTSANSGSTLNNLGLGYRGSGSLYWDMRVPFEAIMTPEQTLKGVDFIDIEPHPSMSLFVTASFVDRSNDSIYTLMSKNFFGEVGKFFLKDAEFTKLESGVVSDDLKFSSGSWYGARLKILRSTKGVRTYTFESGASGNNTPYGKFGGKRFQNDTWYKNTFPLPQDPRQHTSFRETFTMYSRPSAFGPAVGGRPTGSNCTLDTVQKRKPVDSFSGFNWAYTPPYYNGEAWVDFIFKPNDSTTYDLDTILSEIKTVYWRVDPGYSGSGYFGENGLDETALLSSFCDFSGSKQAVYSGKNVNINSMQISSSINLFGIESVDEQELDKFGNKLKTVNKSTGKKWIIQPKWETPMMNFNDEGVRPITGSSDTLTLPTYGSGAVPNGMWHQFGTIPDKPDMGVFLEIGDIPVKWLKNHYDVINDNHLIYNDNDASGVGQKVYKKMKSLVDLLGFNNNVNKARLGELAEKNTLREAIVMVPYIVESVSNTTIRNSGVSAALSQTRKRFFTIPTERYESALSSQIGSAKGDSLETAGESIRKLVQKMERYILPPQFDFLNNEDVDPMVMYMFEFEYELDRDDLSYIWQNLAPRNYEKITLEAKSVSHQLLNTELLEEDNIMENENLRWMVFKVKQKSQASYDDLVVSQMGSSKRTMDFGSKTRGAQTSESGYSVGFNWPHDYVSFVEMIKIDAEVLYEPSAITTAADITAAARTAGRIETGGGVQTTPTIEGGVVTDTPGQGRVGRTVGGGVQTTPTIEGGRVTDTPGGGRGGGRR